MRKCLWFYDYNTFIDRFFDNRLQNLLESRLILRNGFRKELNQFFGYFFRFLVEMKVYEVGEYLVFDLLLFGKYQYANVRKWLFGSFKLQFVEFYKQFDRFEDVCFSFGA